MKLRIKGNSVRLRLGVSEVRRLLNEGWVEERAIFAMEEGLVYSVRAEKDVKGVSASFVKGEIRVEVPMERVKAWAGSEEVGIEAVQENGVGEMRILIEKDFACVDGKGGEEGDVFPGKAGFAKSDE